MRPPWHELAGRFLVFDGPDGSGKSTQFRRFAEAARGAGVTVVEAREPGGTPVGEDIRKVLLHPFHDAMDLRCEMLLYMASRAELVHGVIRPALERGKLVLADRFVSSTLAYQGTAGGLPLDDIEAVADVAVGETRPDLVIVFDVDGETAAKRMAAGKRPREFVDADLDRMEAKGAGFHARVRRGFLAQAAAAPERYAVIDASADEEAVWGALCETVGRRFAANDEVRNSNDE